MDSWEDGFDTWTPRPGARAGEQTDTGTDLNREELLRLARELAANRQGEQEQARVELEELKRLLRERADAVAARERELEQLQKRLEGSRRFGRRRVEGRRGKGGGGEGGSRRGAGGARGSAAGGVKKLRGRREAGQDVSGRESMAARERATLERERAAEARERE